MLPRTENVFEYYFVPCRLNDGINPQQCQNVLEYEHSVLKPVRDTGNFRMDVRDTYAHYEPTNLDRMHRMAYLYRKYIKLNAETHDYIEESIAHVIGGKRVLAVHVRGTDFKLGLSGHPVAVQPKDFVDAVRNKLVSDNYDSVFLATEDSDILELFKKEFAGQLLFYDDVFRTSGVQGPHNAKSDRPQHHYKLGLEILRDIYTLAACESLICGITSVCYIARIVNLAFFKEYKNIIILNNGINQKDSLAAKKVKKEIGRQLKESNIKCTSKGP